jgi:hypothetical protein
MAGQQPGRNAQIVVGMDVKSITSQQAAHNEFGLNQSKLVTGRFQINSA